MIRARKIGHNGLKLIVKNAGEATMAARALNALEQASTVGPFKDDDGTTAMMVEFESSTARNAAAESAKTMTLGESRPSNDNADETAKEGTKDMTTTKTTKAAAKKSSAKKGSTKRPTRGAKKAAAKKGAAKKAGAKAPAKKKAAAKKGGKHGVGKLVNEMLTAGKSEEAIFKAVAKDFPDSKFNDRPKVHLAYYRHKLSKG
jgi:hypothetical protein